MHAHTTSFRRVAATSALALVALSGAAGTAVAAPGNQGNGKGGDGPSSNRAAPEADRPQGKAKAKGHSNAPKPSSGSSGSSDPNGSSGGSAPNGSSGSGGSGSASGSGGGQDGGQDGGGTRTKGSPPGNNGTVKIAPLGEMDGIPQNSPHVGCEFQVEWYGYDEGPDVVSQVSFAMQAPTGDVGLTVNGPSEVFVGEDPASGAGRDLDAVQAYTLSFDGEPHPQQGYHVKLTVNTPRSNGSDAKTKVFWVEGCDDTTPEPSSASEELEGPDSGSESGSESGSASGSQSGSESGAGSESGTAARSGVSQDVATSSESDTPSEVDAGGSGNLARGSIIGLLVAAAGGGLLWYARRARAHG